MIRLLTIIGARPQIIKAAAVSRAIKKEFSNEIEERILHTGQHYDQNMSQVFIDELGIPEPNYNLHVGSGSHGTQTAKMIEGIEQVLTSEHFDGIILYGDTNSTLAGAVAAAKIHIPVFHIEAGLRSYNMSMPEEVNRIVCDHVSSILFAPTQTAVENLKQEGFDVLPAKFKNGKGRKVVLSGDVMFDNSIYFAEIAAKKSSILDRFGLSSNTYILTTIHRDNNTDDPKRLTAIFKALLDISNQERINAVLPLHPRTAKMMEANVDAEVLEQVRTSSFFKIIPPASFLDIIQLERNAHIVMTDSGGVQKEAFFFEKPCVIMRPETEWVEIVEHGAGILVDADYDKIVSAYNELSVKQIVFPPLFGDAHAAERIMQDIIHYLN